MVHNMYFRIFQPAAPEYPSLKIDCSLFAYALSFLFTIAGKSFCYNQGWENRKFFDFDFDLYNYFDFDFSKFFDFFDYRFFF